MATTTLGGALAGIISAAADAAASAATSTVRGPTPRTTAYPYGYPYSNPNSYVYYSNNAAIIAAALVVGFYVLGGIIFTICYCVRQKRRKAWYGPMAKYYRDIKQGGASHYPVGTTYSTPYNPPAHYQTHSSRSNGSYTAVGHGGANVPLMYSNDHDQEAGFHPKHQSTNPFGTPYSTNNPLPESSYGQGGLGYQTAAKHDSYGPPQGAPPFASYNGRPQGY